MPRSANRERRQRAIEFLFGNQDTSSGPGPYVRNAFPAYRVFLFGYEITEDVTSITIQNHIGKAPNTCVISVLNERDKYVLTHEDMLLILGSNSEISRRPSRNLELSTEDLANLDDARVDQTIEELAAGHFENVKSATGISLDDDYGISNANSLKSQIFKLKQQHEGILVSIIDENGEIKGEERRKRWAFAEGLPVFHPNDPLRVFVRDLFIPTIWYYGFSGLVTDVTDDISKDNMKTLSISSEDPTKLLRYARATTNPGINDSVALTAADEAERQNNSSPLDGKTLVQIFDYLIFGSHREVPASPPVPVATIREQRIDAANPTFRRSVLEDEGELRQRIIATGLIGDPAVVDPNNLTPAQRAELDAAVERTRARAVASAEAQDLYFPIESINQYGETVTRRFGLTGVGSFKPAKDRRAAGFEHLFEQSQSINQDVANFGIRLGLISGDAEEFRKADDALRAAVQAAAAGPHVVTLGTDLDAAESAVASIVSLEQWDSLTSWTVQSTDIQTLLSKDTTQPIEATFADRIRNVSTIDDVITLIGTDPAHFPVDGGSVFMLMPFGAGSVGREVVGEQLLGGYALKTGEFQNRLALCYQALERIEFLFYCTPKGDLIVEFPLYDFDPNDFGTFREPTYVVETSDLFNVSSTISDASVKTIARVDVALTNQQDVQSDARDFLQTIVVMNPALFPVYGTRQEIGNRDGLIQTAQAARLYCNILLNRLNADAHSVSLPIIPRFDIGLNRPVLWKVRNHIGTTVSVVHNLAWNGSWRTTLNLNHQRGWVGQRVTGADALFSHRGSGRVVANELVYVPVGGGAASRPINYKVLFQRNGPQQGQDINTGERSSGSTPSQEQPAASGDDG